MWYSGSPAAFCPASTVARRSCRCPGWSGCRGWPDIRGVINLRQIVAVTDLRLMLGLAGENSGERPIDHVRRPAWYTLLTNG
jgi:hypothetical protein